MNKLLLINLLTISFFIACNAGITESSFRQKYTQSFIDLLKITSHMIETAVGINMGMHPFMCKSKHILTCKIVNMSVGTVFTINGIRGLHTEYKDWKLRKSFKK